LAITRNLERVPACLRLLLGSLLVLLCLVSAACEDDAAYVAGQALPTTGVDGGGRDGAPADASGTPDASAPD
jgi:hypothetical protein